jgi:hypothetical protein
VEVHVFGITASNRLVGVVVALVLAWTHADLFADAVPVRYTEGLVHGFLTLRTLDGRAVADGDLTQVVRGARVTARLAFTFRDGSRHDETVVFTQRKEFRLVTYHLTQRGPSFPQPLEMTMDAATGQVTVHYRDEHGKEKTESERMELPPDVANGFIQTVIKNLPSGAPVTLSYVAATPKPRLVKLQASPAETPDRFVIGRRGREARHYVIKAEIGGVAGLVAPLVGKQPPDSHVWISSGDSPVFVKGEQTLYTGGPVWRIELASPAWPAASAAATTRKKSD